MRKSPSTSTQRRISRRGGRRLSRIAAIGATLVASVAGTAMPVGASSVKTMSEAGGCGVLNPPNAANGRGYGIATHDTLHDGVFSDSGLAGTATAKPIGGDICGTFDLPYASGNPGNAPGTNPNIPITGANIDPSNFHYGSAALTAPIGPLGGALNGEIDIYAAGPTTITARQQPRPNGAIDLDVQTEIVAEAKNIQVLGLIPTTADCWLGSDPGTYQVPNGPLAGATPVTAFLSTAPPPDAQIPPGGQPPQPVTGRLDGASAVVVASPISLKAEGCTVAGSPILGTGAQLAFQSGYLSNPASFSAPFTLRLSLT